MELPNGNRFAIAPDPHIEEQETSAGIGYHGYDNAAGSLNDEHATLRESRVLSNPALVDGDETSEG
jgi:type VI secretion system secreted protein VgrG